MRLVAPNSGPGATEESRVGREVREKSQNECALAGSAGCQGGTEGMSVPWLVAPLGLQSQRECHPA